MVASSKSMLFLADGFGAIVRKAGRASSAVGSTDRAPAGFWFNEQEPTKDSVRQPMTMRFIQGLAGGVFRGVSVPSTASQCFTRGSFDLHGFFTVAARR